MEENAMEVIEAKYGIKGSAIVLKLLCKIYKEGYFIRWDEEQCLIFANKAGREVQAAEVQGIIEILFIKGILDRNSYLANGILTSANIQKIWMEATKRRKRDLKALPYLLVNDLTQQETEAPEGENVTISPGNVVHDVAVNAKNACNSGQSKVKKSNVYKGAFSDSSLESAFQFYLLVRSQNWGEISDEQVNALREDLLSLSSDLAEQKAILNKAAAGGWKNLYPVQSKRRPKTKKQPEKQGKFKNFEEREYEDMTDLTRKLMQR